MNVRPDDIDDARRLVSAKELVAEASTHLTTEVAMTLPFHVLVPFKTALKRFFSAAPWEAEDDRALSDLVTPHLDDGWWEHDLGDGLRMAHGITDGRYALWVSGGEPSGEHSVFDRAFSGPVIPQQTPHPRKVKFSVGGSPAPGNWYRRGEDIDDERVVTLMEAPDVSDVMVAGDFVTVGLDRKASWEDRLEEVLGNVTDLFWDGAATAAPTLTREELIGEGRGVTVAAARPEDLHLLDPDDPVQREMLIAAFDQADARARRAAVATLGVATEDSVAVAAILTGFHDASLLVRRTAIDSAADREDQQFRALFHEALFDRDSWIRWKAVRSIADLGTEPSIDVLVLAAVDEDFRVRFEAEAALRGHRGR